MKHPLTISFFVCVCLLLVACGATSGQSAALSTPIPTVVADNVIIAEGRLEPIQYADIAFNANGTVSEVLVAEGEQVTAGQVIARLDNSEARQAEVAQAEEAFLAAQQAFDSAEVTALGKLAAAHEKARKTQNDLDNFTIPIEIREMSITEALTYTAQKLEEARLRFEPYKYQEKRLERELNRVNPKEQNEQVYRSTVRNYKRQLDDAWADYNRAIKWATLKSEVESAHSELAKYQKEYDLLSSGNNTGDKALAVTQYEAARAKLAAAQAALADVELHVPFEGTVASLDIKTGETVSSGQVAVILADFSGWVVKTTDLTELDVVSIKEGQTVQITLDAFPEEVLEGIVLLIGQKYSEKQGDIVYEVTVELTEALQNMRWGMTTVVKFTE